MDDSVTVAALAPSRPQASVLREHGSALAVAGASTLGILAVATVHPHVVEPLLHLPSALLVLVVVADLALVRLVWERLRTRDPWRVVWGRLRPAELATERLIGLAVAGFIGRWLMLNAVAWKLALAQVNPFAYDIPLAQLDAWLHGGEAWRLFPLPDWAMRGLDAFYYGWFAIFAAVMLWWGWQAPSARRRRFLLAMTLVWTVSALLAVTFSSAGPIFYTRVTGLALGFDAMASRIDALGLVANSMQHAVWGVYVGEPTGVIAGIAAFPSVHVAIPALYAVSSRGRWRWGWWAFTALTLAGSIILLWHYAVDGYVGIALAWACWRLAGRRHAS